MDDLPDNVLLTGDKRDAIGRLSAQRFERVALYTHRNSLFALTK